MNIEHFEQEGWTVVRPNGDFTMYNVYEIKGLVLHLIHHGARRFAFDMDSVKALDSAGIGTLISLDREIRQSRGECFLYGCPDMVQQVLVASRVDQLIRVVDSFENGRIE